MMGKRVVFADKGLVKVEEFQLKEPGSDQILIRSACTLISSETEGAFLQALPNTSQSFPQYPGYSNAGIVESVGSKVTHFRRNDRVVSQTNHASHVLEQADGACAIPDGLSFEEAAFFALGAIALNGVRKAQLELGESVAVVGQGLVGQLALQLARLNGAVPLFAIDVLNERLEASMKSGADFAIDSSNMDPKGEVERATAGKGANVVIEATGNPEAIPLACRIASPNGRVILLGSTRGETKLNFYSEVHKKAVSVIGAHSSMRPSRESHRGNWTEMDDAVLVLKLLAQERLKVKHLITSKVPYYEAAQAYRRAIERSTLGIVLDWHQ